MTEILVLNVEADNDSGARAPISYGNLMDQKRYLFANRYVRGKRVLDCACGIGWGSFSMATAGAREVVGLDASPQAIAAAETHFGDPVVRFVCGELDYLRDTEPFDLIVSFETLEHVDNPTKFLTELQSVAKPGSTLLLSTPNWYVTLGQDRTPFNPFHRNEFTRDQVEEFAREGGWLVTEYLGQHPILEGSNEIWAYRNFVRQYWEAALTSKSILRRAASKLRRLGGEPRITDPALVGSCNPVPVPEGSQPVCHVFVLKSPV